MESPAARLARPSLSAPFPLPLTCPISSSLREFQHGALRAKTFARPKKTPALQDSKLLYLSLSRRSFVTSLHISSSGDLAYRLQRTFFQLLCGSIEPNEPRISMSQSDSYLFLFCTAIIILFIVLASAVIQKTGGKRQRGPRDYPPNG